MKKNLFLSILLINNLLLTNVGPEGFGKYLNDYFVETGTYGGDGILKALNAGFKNIRSIEYDNNLFNGARRRFIKNQNIKIWNGSSEILLWDMIKDINTPITFWLDAHIYPPLFKWRKKLSINRRTRSN